MTTDTIKPSSGPMLAKSPFLHAPKHIEENTRTVAHLTRELIQPLMILPTVPRSELIIATDPSDTDEVSISKKRKLASLANPIYNTRFGNFPHSSLVTLPLGSQVRSTTNSGFIHVLNPTPELWTSSLPHRTQVVYTPDSSYVLHRLRARPGTRILEAGAGSGSFTHASTRAIYNGVGEGGKVFSFEFHEDRVGALRKEIKEHGLEGVVRVVGRDVCVDGFALEESEQSKSHLRKDTDASTDTEEDITESDQPMSEHIDASAVFLDLPAPWLAIPHLTRRSSTNPIGPLSPNHPMHICCFSPCMEQSLKTISTLRTHLYTEIELVEVAHKKLEVRRVGAHVREIKEGKDDEQAGPADIHEAISKLTKVLKSRKVAHDKQAGKHNVPFVNHESSTSDDENVDDQIPLHRQGRVITKTEVELKTHTSYLVFAILPILWTDEDEARAAEKWPVGERDETTKQRERDMRDKFGGKLPTATSNRSIKKEQKRLKKEALLS